MAVSDQQFTHAERRVINARPLLKQPASTVGHGRAHQVTDNLLVGSKNVLSREAVCSDARCGYSLWRNLACGDKEAAIGEFTEDLRLNEEV